MWFRQYEAIKKEAHRKRKGKRAHTPGALCTKHIASRHGESFTMWINGAAQNSLLGAGVRPCVHLQIENPAAKKELHKDARMSKETYM